MVQRTALAALALAVLLGTAGCLGLGGAQADQQRDPSNVTVQLEGDDDGATVAVAGRATVTAEPDAATLRLAVVARGDDPETVRNQLAGNASAVRQALLAYGLDEEQVRSEEFSIRENYRARREGAEDVPAFVGTHELVVELDDTGAVGDVIDAAVESGPVRVRGVTFGLSDERREQLRDEALTEAMADARSEAEIVAAAEDLRLRSAERIATDRVSVDRSEGTVVRAAATPTEAADAGSTRVESGEVSVSASVTVVYNASTSTDGE